jgi:hypothetical protein
MYIPDSKRRGLSKRKDPFLICGEHFFDTDFDEH